MPPAALPGAKLLEGEQTDLKKWSLNDFRFKGGCDLTREMRGKAHPLSAFKAFCHSGFATLAAGGRFFIAE